MPSPVATFVSDTWPSAEALNIALYSVVNSQDAPTGIPAPTGIAFHAYRPVLFESYTRALTIPASSGGTQTSLASSGSVTTSLMVYDTAGYAGQTQDQPGAGYYQFLASVVGSAGDGVTAGGWTLVSHFAPITGRSTQTSVSADLNGTAQPSVSGTRQAPSGTLDSCPFFLDLVNAGNTVAWAPAVTIRDSAGSSATSAVNAADSSGETPRFYAVWGAVSATSSGQAVFNAGGSYPWTAPAGVTSVTAANTAAGGGGGAGNVSGGGTEYGGGGAGGGEFAKGSVAVTPGNTYTVVVGAAGAGGVTGVASGNGGAGGDSIFTGDAPPAVHAHGGSGGSGASVSANGAGGAAGTGSTNTTHHDGGAGAAGATAASGGGGGSSAGTGQAGATATGPNPAPAPPGGGPGGAGGQAGITVVQAVHYHAAGNKVSASFPSAVQAGNTVVAFVIYQGTKATTDPVAVLSDGTAMTDEASADLDTMNVPMQVVLYDAYNVTGGQTGITVTGKGQQAAAIGIQMYEVAGLGTAPTINAQNSNSVGGGSADVNSYSVSVNTTTAPQIWFGAAGGQQTSSFNVNAPKSSEGWICLPQSTPSAPGGGYPNVYSRILSGYQYAAATGTAKFSGTYSQKVSSGAIVAAYQTSAVTTGVAPVIGPGGGGGAALGSGNNGGNGADGQVILTWTGISGSGYGTPAIPAPYSSWSESTTVGAGGPSTVNLNGPQGIRDVCNFLSNPPVLRVSSTTAQAIATGTITSVTFGNAAATVDSYAGWVPASSTYTVQRQGLYLFHGLAAFANCSGGPIASAVTINGTSYWGPATTPPSSGTGNVAKTQVFSLDAGDTVQFAAYQATGGSVNLATTDQTRMLLVYLCETGVPPSLWSPPDTTFRWQAGTPGENLGGNLSALFQQHLGNDLGFLAGRPYFMGYQSAAQTGLTVGSFTTVTLDQVKGRIHGSENGDNYSGWNSGSNIYVAQEPGWYLACAEVFASAASGTGQTVTAAILSATSGGVTPAHTPDQYQQLTASTASVGGGAAVFGLYYLSIGESVALQVRASGYNAAYQTIVGSRAGGTSNSHLECIWMSE
jgi:hypothetical protein